jgi:arginyl-tRNA synthetase
MQYAYARIRSIFRKEKGSGTFSAGVSNLKSQMQVAEPAERVLAVKLLQFPETVEAVAAECLPNLLCAYLYDLAGAFMGFYETCPVLKADEPTRAGRLALCDLTARTIATGLSLLGIEVLDRM